MKYFFEEIQRDEHKYLSFEHDEFKIIFTKDSDRGDYKKSEEDGLANINHLKELLNLKELLFLNQTHSTLIHYNPLDVIDGDGIITDQFDRGIGVFGADCTPVVIIDVEKKVVGVVHSGWKGTLNQIVKSLINRMHNDFKCSTKDMRAIIGPHARDCCYEVSEEMISTFNEKTIFKGKVNSGRMLNMSMCIKLSLQDMGFVAKNICDIEKCTICNPEFHSYRRDGEQSGRNIAIVMMSKMNN